MNPETPAGDASVRKEIAMVRKPRVAGLRAAGLAWGCLAVLFATACEPSQHPAPKPPATHRPVAAAPAPPASAAALSLPPPRVPAAALTPPARPRGTPTGTFLDRAPGTGLRFMSYNVLWNHIFAEVSETHADKFVRLVRAIDPDIIALQEIGLTDFLRKEGQTRDWSADEVAHLLNAIAPLPAGETWHAFRGADNVVIARFPLRQTRTDTVPAGDRDQAIALIDLPDAQYAIDLYVLNNHYKCCDPVKNDPRRQQQSDSIVAWLRDARTPGGEFDLPARTAFIVCGDLNIVGSFQPVQTLVDGDIQDEAAYGADFPLDWDNTALTDLHPRHNVFGPDDYTWRNDLDRWDPGRIDFIIYTDSVLEALHSFVLNTTTMTPEQLSVTGLQARDVCADTDDEDFDHFPLVVDFRVLTGE